jgi:ABC-2 type transport system ATP-binding protein
MSLELKNIWFSYKKFKILQKINFTFEEKWLYSITGRSGSWKTTLLKIIWWFLKPDSWEIFFRKKNLYKEIDIIDFRQNIIWFSYQKLHLIDELSVEDNLNLKAKLIWKKIDNSWKKYLLEFFEINNLLEKKISEISWWQALRVSLIKAVLLKPKILLLDEPESWLDSKLIKKLQNFYNDYSKDNLVIISSHFLNKWQNENLEINKI